MSYVFLQTQAVIYALCISFPRFFGSRFDDENNFEGRTFGEVAVDLAALATAVAKVMRNNCRGVVCLYPPGGTV